MNHRARIGILLLFLPAVVTLIAPGAWAQDIPSPYRFIEQKQEAGLFTGVVSASTGAFDFGPEGGPVVGIRYGLHLNGPISLQASVGYLTSTRSVIDPALPEGSRKVGEADVQLALPEASLKFSLVGHRTWHGLGPFVVVGGGGAFDLSSDQQIDLEVGADDRFDFGNSFAGHLGAGTRWVPGERLSFRAEARLILWQLNTPRGYSDPARELESVSEDEWVSGAGILLGIGYSF